MFKQITIRKGPLREQRQMSEKHNRNRKSGS